MFSADNMVNYILANEEPVALQKAIDALKNKDVFLVGFSGKKGSGKDTMAEIFKESFEHDFGAASFAPFGDPLKGEATAIISFIQSYLATDIDLRPAEFFMLQRMSELFDLPFEDARALYDIIMPEVEASNSRFDGWTRTRAVWKVLRMLGTDIRQPQDKIYWVRRSVHNIIVNANNGISTIVQDTRFLHEVKALKDMGAYVARVDIEPEVQVKRLMARDNVEVTPDALTHASEVELDEYPDFDIRVNNSVDGAQVELGAVIYNDWLKTAK
ncbi:MAG: hypothetical protein H9W81_01145 [Enterococcus sp.]|nr:hypothetical protein [Enterococcus sp.]